jgi:16S rRNA (guanine966-N2)-methyltransferase
MFSILATEVPGSRFLDMCAGTGAVGIEAWSRGASHVCWVESHPRVLQILRSNVSKLCGSERTEVIGMDVLRFLRQSGTQQAFDVAFCDPQYVRGVDMERQVLLLLSESKMLRDKGLLVFEQADDVLASVVSGWTLVDDRRYGGTRLRFWRPE